MWPYILAGAAAILYFANSAKNSILEKLQINFSGVRFDWINLRFSLVLDIFNPLPTEIKISSFNGKILSGNTQIADVISNTEMVLKPGSNKYSLSGLPLAGNIFSSIGNLTNQPLTLNYSISSGFINYNGSKIIFAN